MKNLLLFFSIFVFASCIKETFIYENKNMKDSSLLAVLQHRDTTTFIRDSINIRDSIIIHRDTTTIVRDSINIITLPPITLPPIAYTIIHPTCTIATGSVTLTGLPSGTWTINPLTITGIGTTTTINKLTAGTHYIVVTNLSGYISPTITITINPQPETPTAPVLSKIVQPTATVPFGSVILTCLPITGMWTITKYPQKISFNGVGRSVTINYLDPKGSPDFTPPTGSLKSYTTIYNFTVTNEKGCTSPLSVDIPIISYN